MSFYPSDYKATFVYDEPTDQGTDHLLCRIVLTTNGTHSMMHSATAINIDYKDGKNEQFDHACHRSVCRSSIDMVLIRPSHH